MRCTRQRINKVVSIRLTKNARGRGPTRRGCSKGGTEGEEDTRSCCVLKPTKHPLMAVPVLDVKSGAGQSRETRFHRRRKISKGRALTPSKIAPIFGTNYMKLTGGYLLFCLLFCRHGAPNHNTCWCTVGVLPTLSKIGRTALNAALCAEVLHLNDSKSYRNFKGYGDFEKS